MSKIISDRKCIECERTFVWFQDPNNSGCGWSFNTDSSGSPILNNEKIKANYQKCLNLGLVPKHDKHEWHYWEPAILECDCGEHVELMHFTNTCDCGNDYNKSGQKLAPRHFWGEETGESLSDILSIK